MCDAQPTAAESDALAGLIVACVLQAARDAEEGVPDLAPTRRLIEENVWRATRRGMDGRLIDPVALEEVDARAAVEALLEWTAPARREHGLGEPALPERNSAQRQRALLAEGLSPREVYAATVRETMATYPEEVPTA
jgi:carboxylate-amine ligase